MLVDITHILQHPFYPNCFAVYQWLDPSKHVALNHYSLCHLSRRPQKSNIKIKELNKKMCTIVKL